MTNDERNPKPERRGALWCAMARSSFGFRYSFGFRHSSFGFGSWFMESFLGLATVHWDQEPNRPPARPRPRNQAIGSRTRTTTRTRTKGRFMESPLAISAVHRDHEPCQLVGRGVLTAPRLGGLRTARPTLRFMESPHVLDPRTG